MRKLVVLMFIISACNSPSTKRSPAKAARTNDTTFLYRKVTKDDYCVTYIEKNRQSEYYKVATNFKFDGYETVSYKETHDYLTKQLHKSFKKINLQGLPTEWLRLYLFRGKYYLYLPSEAGSLWRRMVSDTALIYWGMEGPDPLPIYDFKKVSDYQYLIRSKGYYLNSKTAVNNVYIIDPKYKIAIWEDLNQKDVSRYDLYVPKEYAGHFDVIANYCSNNKTAEFEFDPIDYQALIKDFKQKHPTAPVPGSDK